MTKTKIFSPKAIAKLHRRDRIIAWGEWIVICLIICVDAVLDKTIGIPIDVSSKNIWSLLIILGLWPLFAIGTRVTKFGIGSEIIAENIAKFLIFIATGSMLEYYLAMSPMPPADDLMLGLDKMIGFDWPGFYDWVHAHKLIHKILAFCYFSLLYESAFVLLIVGIFYPRRAARFSTALIFSGLLALVSFWIFPVAGPFVIFGHTDLPQANYTAHYLGMRTHTLASIPMEDIRGIVSFPSYHVCSAVIMTWFLRGLPVIYILAILLNIGMAIGALVIGGHYLVDVIAGVALGLVTIWLLSWLEKGHSQSRLPFSRS